MHAYPRALIHVCEGTGRCEHLARDANAYAASSAASLRGESLETARTTVALNETRLGTHPTEHIDRHACARSPDESPQRSIVMKTAIRS